MLADSQVTPEHVFGSLICAVWQAMGGLLDKPVKDKRIETGGERFHSASAPCLSIASLGYG